MDPSRAHQPYSRGALAVQTRAGVRDQAEHVGRSIGPGIRPVAAAFLGLQPMLVLGAADGMGRMWCSLLTGPPGFVRATGPRSVSVAGAVPDGDPLGPALAGAAVPVGTIALDPRTRRRMRLNGLARPGRRGLAIEAERVFSNCPRHLQKRALRGVVPDAAPAPGAVRHGGHLTPDQVEFVRAADTFFIASGSGARVEASHRGGNPGFVRVETPGRLSWQDYPGNAMFLTLGNLETDPRAGLLFLDWTDGTTLQLTGAARAEFAADGARAVRFDIEETVENPGASPLRWSEPEYSPANPQASGH